jgi:uncharacterized glyoxalase superfamily protein PhnB
MEMTPTVSNLIPYAHVMDVQRSIAFYELLGFKIISRHEHPPGRLLWAHLECGFGRLMLAQADGPVDPTVQAILFYLYADDVVALRAHLMENSVEVSEINRPFYMPDGEIRIADPDGYCLLIGQLKPLKS